ncbi:hypothetical protein ZWY2020_015631 [Hordeum vulgare]|nr:hypothetical protein ZWY2020_015631 [Hordeum vulgare]
MPSPTRGWYICVKAPGVVGIAAPAASPQILLTPVPCVDSEWAAGWPAARRTSDRSAWSRPSSSTSPRPLPRPHVAREVSPPPIPEELLLDIFRRIPDPADLVLTSAACVTFRRLITDRSFLRRYRRLHAPPLLGFLQYSDNAFHPAAPPYPSAPAARAVALAGDFSFSFVPAPVPAHRWVVRDVRDGRVLLEATPGKTSRLSSQSWRCATRCTGGISCFPQSLVT